MTLTSATLDHGSIVLLFANNSHDPSAVRAVDSHGRSCTYTGTLMYAGRTGINACSALLSDLGDGDHECIDRAVGNFCLVLQDEVNIRVLTDRAGLHHVYHTTDYSTTSNSFLALAATLKTRTLQVQEILEYILLAATYGTTTVIREVNRLHPDKEIRLDRNSARVTDRRPVWPAPASQITLPAETLIDECMSLADNYYAQIASCFGTRTTAALSGGYDSRLNLAILLRHGVRPKLFVYGGPNDTDVAIAKLICEKQGFPLQHFDRCSVRQLAPEEYWENQEIVFNGLDGVTQYGYACSPDELSHRMQRAAGGWLAINGGGGEIWRDFWKIPDGPLTPAQFIKWCYSGRVSALNAAHCNEAVFFGHLADKLALALSLKTAEGALSSSTVQSLYARFRVRHWQGPNNTVDNHIGLAITPFAETHFSVPAMRIPLRAKRHGWFEQQLLIRMSPELAAFTSAYGYSLARGPDFLRRAGDAFKWHVPPWLRAAKRRMGTPEKRPYYQSKPFVEQRFGRGQLAVEEFVLPDRLMDCLAFSRALLIERLIRGEWSP
jgi:asparagine synthase (glutamine-hydrolysing)